MSGITSLKQLGRGGAYGLCLRWWPNICIAKSQASRHTEGGSRPCACGVGGLPATARPVLLSAPPFVPRGWPSHQSVMAGLDPTQILQTKEPEFYVQILPE